MTKTGKKDLDQRLEAYIQAHYMPDLAKPAATEIPAAENTPQSKGMDEMFHRPRSLEELIQNSGESFQQMLFREIRERHMTETEVYKRANVDRRLFSKIRQNPAYHPEKNTVISLAVALKMNRKEAEDFLASAGYAFSPASKRDLVICFFLEEGISDPDEINRALFDRGLQELK